MVGAIIVNIIGLRFGARNKGTREHDFNWWLYHIESIFQQ